MNAWAWLGFFLLYFLLGVFSTFAELSLFRAAGQLYQTQERESIWHLLNRSRKQFCSYVGLSILVGIAAILIFALVGFVLWLVDAILLETGPESKFFIWGIAGGLLALLFIRGMMGAVLYQGTSAMVVEELTAFDAYDRSYFLVKKYFLKYLLVVLLLGFLSLGFLAATELPFTASMFPSLPDAAAEVDWFDFVDHFIAYLNLDVETLRPLYLWPVVIVLEGLLSAFATCVWTVMFIETREEPDIQIGFRKTVLYRLRSMGIKLYK